MLSINTNISAEVASTALNNVSGDMTETMATLSTGVKAVNAASADEAFVINLETRQGSLNQFLKNAQDGLSLVNTAAANNKTVTSILQQMKVLSQQSANGIYSTSDREGFQTKLSGLNSELSRLASTASFNGVSLGSASATVSIFLNDASSLGVSVSIADLTTSSTGLGTSGLDISTSSGAVSALTTLDTALDSVATAATNYASSAQRLQFSMNSLQAAEENTSKTLSNNQDTDYASATSKLAREKVLSSASNAMLAQANQAPQSVIQLLRG